jgi:ribose 1,5-bisphosphokinase
MSAAAPRIGPGALVVVVGPSGAGKDTLIALARTLCRDDPRIVFPRRIVTRQPSAAEDHDSIAPGAFDAAMRQGAFAFCWEAHGLKYALPVAIDAELARGNRVVCNVSRGIVGALRARYAHVTAVLVTAPKEVLAARLGARGREGGGDVTERIERAAPDIDELAPNLVVENVGDPHDGAQRLATLLRRASATA